MTIRQLGEVVIKVLGVYYAVSTMLGLVTTLLSAPLMPQGQGISVGRVVAMNLVGVLGMAVVSGACLLRAQMFAGLLFSNERVPLSNMSRYDCLFVGISIVGLVWAVSGVPEIMKIAAQAIWYAEGSRQPLFAEVMRQSSESFVNAALSVLVGVGLVMSARRLAGRLDTEYSKNASSSDRGAG